MRGLHENGLICEGIRSQVFENLELKWGSWVACDIQVKNKGTQKGVGLRGGGKPFQEPRHRIESSVGQDNFENLVLKRCSQRWHARYRIGGH